MRRSNEERLPGRRIEVIEHRNGATAELRLIMPQAVFYAKVGHDEKRDKNGDVVRAWVKEQLGKQGAATDWTPVIEVHLQSTDRGANFDGRTTEHSTGFDVHLLRYYVARTVAGSWRAIGWFDAERITDSAKRLAQSARWGGFHVAEGEDLTLPIRSKDDWRRDNAVILAYTPELWAGLVAVSDTVKAAEKQLRQHLGDDKALLSLQAFATERLLALPPVAQGTYCDDDECGHHLTEHRQEDDGSRGECQARDCMCTAFVEKAP